MAFDLGNIFVTIKAKTEDLERSLAQLGLVGSTAEGKLTPLGKVVGGIETVAKVTATAVAAAGTALAGAGVAGIKSAGEFEQSRVAFETMLGSADKARKMMQDISDFAKSTPFELPQVVEASKQLLAFGFAQDQIIPTMRRLGDIASGVGVPVGQLTNVFGQVRVAGKLMGGDLLQFTNAGIPMIEELAKVLHVSQGEVKQMVEQGKVGFGEVEQVINNLTNEGGRFGGMMEKQSHTFNGVVSNIKDGFGQVLRSAVGLTSAGDIVEGGLFDRVKRGAEAVMPKLQEFGDKVGPAVMAGMEKGGQIAKDVWDKLKQFGEFLNSVFGPSVRALVDTFKDRLWPALQNLWDLLVRLEPLWKAIGIVIGAVLVAAVWLLINVINVVISAFSWWINVLTAVYNAAITTFTAIVNAVQWLWQTAQAVFNGILAVVTAVFSAIWAFVEPIINLIIAIFNIWFGVVSYIFSVIRGLAVATFQAVYDFIKPVLDALGAAFNWLGGVFGAVFGWIGNVASGVWNAIASGFSWAKDRVVGVWNGIKDFFSGIWNHITSTVGGVAGAISNAFSGAFEGAKNILKSGVNWMIDQVNKVIRAVNSSAGKLPGVPDIPQIAKLFRGARHFLGGWALVGDQGPELINLNRGADVATANESRQMLANASNVQGGIVNNIFMNGANITSPHLAGQYAEKMGDMILERLKQNVRL